MKNKKEIMNTVSTILYLAAAVLFVLSIVGSKPGSGIVQPMYLLYGAIALGVGSILKNAANRQE